MEEKTEKECPEKNKIKKKKSNFVKDYIVDYTSNSNLHGLKYLGERERTVAEKIFWLFAIVCCMYVCAVLIGNVWKKWNETPVIVTFAENTTPVWQIPYPAVTICSETKTMPTRFNFTDYYKHRYWKGPCGKGNMSMSRNEQDMFEDLLLVCDRAHECFSDRNISHGNSTVNNLMKVAPDMDDLFMGCTWNNTDVYYKHLFTSILTEKGICFTFNMLSAEELFRKEKIHEKYKYILSRDYKSQSWTLDKGYAPKTPVNTYPHRGVGYGVEAGLEVVMFNKRTDLDYLCSYMQGAKVLLHNPAELPRPRQQYFRVPLTQEVVAAVKPKMMITSEGLRNYDPERRQCYYPSERYLEYFKVYTQANCEYECLINYTYARCKCVHVAMPHSPHMNVCNVRMRSCVKEARNELVVTEILDRLERDSLPEDVSFDKLRQVAAQCKCLPACTSISYDVEISQDENDWVALFRGRGIDVSPEAQKNNMFSRVIIFFKEPEFIKLRRSELFGQTDFLANCGGLLGLLMGFSILSVVEIIYFLTLRLCGVIWTRKANKKKYKSQLPKAENLTKKGGKPGTSKQLYVD